MASIDPSFNDQARNDQAALDWNSHEEEILDLFVTQNKTLNEVMTYMREKHNFMATTRMYKARFSNLKNLKADEWLWIGQEIECRAVDGKASQPYLYGRPLPLERVHRETSRHKVKTARTISINPMPNPSPGRISVKTPPPQLVEVILGPPGPPANSTHACTSEEDEPSTDIMISWEDFEMQQGCLDPANPTHGQIFRLDTGMDLDMAAEENIYNLNLSEEWDFDFDGETSFGLATSSHPSLDTMGRPLGIREGSSSRPQSAGRGLPSFSQFINLKLLDTNPGLHLTIDLPWFRLLSAIEHLGNSALHTEQPLSEISLSFASMSMSLTAKARQTALVGIIGSQSELQLAESISYVSDKLQKVIPERYEGEISHKIGHIFDSRSPSLSILASLFGLAAYFASNNRLPPGRMDNFLQWVIDHKCIGYLERFLSIDTSTIHAFATAVLNSAIRIRNVALLTKLLHLGIKFDSVLDDVARMGDLDFSDLVLRKIDPKTLKKEIGIRLLYYFLIQDRFDIAEWLVAIGVSMDGVWLGHTPLYSAVYRRKINRARFLLKLGPNINLRLHNLHPATALGRAVYNKDTEMVALLLEHGAMPSDTIHGMGILDWSSLNCRDIYILLRESSSSKLDISIIGDLVEAASHSTRSLKAYIDKHLGRITVHQLEKCLATSAKLGRVSAVVAFLQHGVDANCATLKCPPLLEALDAGIGALRVCQHLIKSDANANVPGILALAVRKTDLRVVESLVKAGASLEEQGIEALVQAAELNDIVTAEYLLRCGVDINTLAFGRTPLQTAAIEGFLAMVEFLVSCGADINSPAAPNGGLTALQAAFTSHAADLEIAVFLLDNGANVSASPALVGGYTTLEAAWRYLELKGPSETFTRIINRLLDTSVRLNRPDGEPSSALHRAISQAHVKELKPIIARMLEPNRNAIVDYMWCDMEYTEEDLGGHWEPRTPTQLAAEFGHLDIVKLLLQRGADVNEAPASRFGRTALQAVASRYDPDMELVEFLIDRGADINAAPAVHGGITALQGAAIAGNIGLAKFLLMKGAAVNAAPAFVEGRYAIEGAAEHGRLDMVQVLLNAGAKGNVRRKTGLRYAVELAEGNGHFAIANLLKDLTPTI